MAKATKTKWIEKFFVWELQKFDPCKLKKAVDLDYDEYFDGPIQRSFDRYNNLERVCKFEIKFWQDDNDSDFRVNITPGVLDKSCYFYLNDNEKRIQNRQNRINGKFSKVMFCVDVKVPLPNPKPPNNMLANKLKKMFEADPSNNFIIKCQYTNIRTMKPILAACSPVLKAMLETNMKETEENSMEIRDFEPKVVQKMIEFCENDSIAEFEGYEEDVFKIAHKYQMPELMEYAVHQMSYTTTVANRMDRQYMLSQMLNAEQYKKWCSNI